MAYSFRPKNSAVLFLHFLFKKQKKQLNSGGGLCRCLCLSDKKGKAHLFLVFRNSIRVYEIFLGNELKS